MDKEEIKVIMKRVNSHLKKKYYEKDNWTPVKLAQEGAFKAKECLEAYFNEDNKALRKVFEFVIKNGRLDQINLLHSSFKYTLRELGAEKLFTRYFKRRNIQIQEVMNRWVNDIKRTKIEEASDRYDEDFELESAQQMHKGIKHAAKCLKFMLSRPNLHDSSLELALQEFKESKITKGQPYFDGFRAMMYEYNKISFYNEFEEEVSKLKKW